jgi:hypothetical protein
VDERRFDEGAALGVWEANERDARYHGMRAPGKIFQHMAGVVGGAGLAEDAAIERDDGVRGEHDGGADSACGGELGFGIGEALDEFTGRFAGDGSFVDGGSNDGEREAGVVEDFGAARRTGGEN